MTPEQKNLHDLLMSPQLENVELAFQLLEGAAVEFDIQPYRALVRLKNYLDGNCARHEIYREMLWTPKFLHYTTTEMSEIIQRNASISYTPSFSTRHLYGDGLRGLVSKMNTKELFVDSDITYSIAKCLNHSEDIIVHIGFTGKSRLDLKSFLRLPCERLIINSEKLWSDNYPVLFSVQHLTTFFKVGLSSIENKRHISFYLEGDSCKEAISLVKSHLFSITTTVVPDPQRNLPLTRVDVTYRYHF